MIRVPQQEFLDGGALLIVFGIGEINASRVLVEDEESWIDSYFVDELGDGACDVAALVVNIGDDGNIHQPGFQLCLDFTELVGFH